MEYFFLATFCESIQKIQHTGEPVQLGSVKVESGIIVGKINAYECIKHINRKNSS